MTEATYPYYLLGDITHTKPIPIDQALTLKPVRKFTPIPINEIPLVLNRQQKMDTSHLFTESSVPSDVIQRLSAAKTAADEEKKKKQNPPTKQEKEQIKQEVEQKTPEREHYFQVKLEPIKEEEKIKSKPGEDDLEVEPKEENLADMAAKAINNEPARQEQNHVQQAIDAAENAANARDATLTVDNVLAELNETMGEYVYGLLPLQSFETAYQKVNELEDATGLIKLYNWIYDYAKTLVDQANNNIHDDDTKKLFKNYLHDLSAFLQTINQYGVANGIENIAEDINLPPEPVNLLQEQNNVSVEQAADTGVMPSQQEEMPVDMVGDVGDVGEAGDVPVVIPPSSEQKVSLDEIEKNDGEPLKTKGEADAEKPPEPLDGFEEMEKNTGGNAEPQEVIDWGNLYDLPSEEESEVSEDEVSEEPEISVVKDEIDLFKKYGVTEDQINQIIDIIPENEPKRREYFRQGLIDADLSPEDAKGVGNIIDSTLKNSAPYTRRGMWDQYRTLFTLYDIPYSQEEIPEGWGIIRKRGCGVKRKSSSTETQKTKKLKSDFIAKYF